MPWSGIASSLVGLTGNLFGGMLNNSYNSKAAARQYQYNLALQKQAQKWQEYMSNTAHQREVTDLRAAGLNPVLSANGGASTGSVGATSVGMQAPSNIDLGNPVDDFFSAMSKKNESKILEENAKKAEAEADSANVSAINAMDSQREDIINKQLQNDILREQKKQIQYENSALKADSEFYNSGFGKGVKWFDRTIEPLRGVIGGSKKGK